MLFLFPLLSLVLPEDKAMACFPLVKIKESWKIIVLGYPMEQWSGELFSLCIQPLKFIAGYFAVCTHVYTELI